MSHKARITIASTVTALFLAAMSAAGVIVHTHGQHASASAASAPANASAGAPTASWDKEHE